MPVDLIELIEKQKDRPKAKCHARRTESMNPDASVQRYIIPDCYSPAKRAWFSLLAGIRRLPPKGACRACFGYFLSGLSRLGGFLLLGKPASYQPSAMKGCPC